MAEIPTLTVVAVALVDAERVRLYFGARDPAAPLTPYHYVLVADWSRLELYHLISLPSGLKRMVWLASPTTVPSRSARSATQR